MGLKYFITTCILFLNFINTNFANNHCLKNIKGNFFGKIIDAKTNKGIANTNLYFTDVKIGSISDNEGNFNIKNIPDGSHLIEISHIGYATIVETIVINGDTKKDFILTTSIVESNAVIVTGVTGATQLKKVPFSVAVIRKQDFFQNTSTNIIESLTKLGGVSTMSTGPAISKPVIRGLGYNRVLTINDGVRQEGQQWGDEHGIEIDEASVSKIELLKGPASIIYGSDALAGVINIITNVPVQNNTIKANISSNLQSNNKLKSLNANIAGNKNGFNWNMYTSNKSAADYKNKYDGYVFNSKFNEHNIGGYIGYNGDWGYSHILISNFNLTTGMVEGARDSSGNFIKNIAGGGTAIATNSDFNSTSPQIPYQHIIHFKIASDNNFKVGKDYINLNIGYQDNKRQEFGNINVPTEKSLFFDLKTITYTTQYHLAEINGWKKSIGINGMQQSNINNGVEQLIPNYNLFDFGIYTYAQKTIKNITASGGVRFDNRNIDVKNLYSGTSVKGTGFTKSFSNLSGSLGIAAQINNKTTIKLNIAKGFRSPSVAELSTNGVHEGTNRYEYGDANLKSETSLQIDGGIEYNSNHLSVGIAAFYNHFNNFIFYRKLESVHGGDSTIINNGNNLTAFKFDQRESSLLGFEAKFDIHPHPLDKLHIENTFSYVKGIFATAIENNKNIPFIPAAKLSTEFRWNIKSFSKKLENFYAKTDFENTFTQNNVFTTYNTETVTKGFTLINLGVGADIVSKSKVTICSISLSAINIANVAYQNNLSRLKYEDVNMATGRTGVYNMGRNFSLKLNVPLNFNLTQKNSPK